MTQRIRRIGLGLGLAIVCFAGLPACTPRADSTVVPAQEQTAIAPGGTFHLMCEAPGTLDPSLVDDVYEACLVNQIYDGLLEFDTHLNPTPAVAREWSVSRDGREYRFTLRSDVRFHSGRPVVAEDFVWSFTRIFHPERENTGLGGEYLAKIDGVAEYRAGRADRISGLAAENDTTLVIRLAEPYGSFLSVLAMDQTKVVCREAIEAAGDDYDNHPIGTGPFEFAARHDGDAARIVLTRNDDSFRAPAYLDEIVFHIPRDYNIDRAADAMMADELTMCDMPGGTTIQFEDDPRFSILRRPELSTSFVAVNMDQKPLRDVRVRRALAHAINRARLVKADPVGRIEAGSILPPGMFGYSPEKKTLRYDPDLARTLLAEAGYPGGEGLPVVPIYQPDRGEVGRAQDQMVGEDLRAVGFDPEFRYVEWDQFSEDMDHFRLPGFGLTWVADVPDPDSFLASLFATTGAYNVFRYSNATVDSLLVAGTEMRSSGDRAEVYQRAERMILSEAPVIPLFHIANNFAVRSEVRDLFVTPFGIGNLAFERVWLAPAPVS